MESQDQDQLWACLTCKAVRAWGTGEPGDAAFVPILRCDSCGGPQRFVHVIDTLADPSGNTIDVVASVDSTAGKRSRGSGQLIP